MAGSLRAQMPELIGMTPTAIAGEFSKVRYVP
jgi:hypothetical protein